MLPFEKSRLAKDVYFLNYRMFILLNDGREIVVPIDWFPKIRDASDKERANWRLIGQGEGIHWEDLDEDILVEALL